MKVERMELVGLEVSDLDAAIEEFGELLGVEFVRIELELLLCRNVPQRILLVRR